MQRIAVIITLLSLITTSLAQGVGTKHGRKPKPMQRGNETKMVAPALERYAQGVVAELWKRLGLSLRDRSIVTIAALIARNQTIEMSKYLNLARR